VLFGCTRHVAVTGGVQLIAVFRCARSLDGTRVKCRRVVSGPRRHEPGGTVGRPPARPAAQRRRVAAAVRGSPRRLAARGFCRHRAARQLQRHRACRGEPALAVLLEPSE
jgi:hypothetical protein